MERPATMDLDQVRIGEAAKFAAERLWAVNVARVRLAPGDMTEYPILIAGPGVEWGYAGDGYGPTYDRQDHWVALCSSFGAGYFWRPGTAVAPSYAAEKWTHLGRPDGTRMWTGWVISDFLNAVTDELSEDRS